MEHTCTWLMDRYLFLRCQTRHFGPWKRHAPESWVSHAGHRDWGDVEDADAWFRCHSGSWRFQERSTPAIRVHWCSFVVTFLRTTNELAWTQMWEGGSLRTQRMTRFHSCDGSDLRLLPSFSSPWSNSGRWACIFFSSSNPYPRVRGVPFRHEAEDDPCSVEQPLGPGMGVSV